LRRLVPYPSWPCWRLLRRVRAVRRRASFRLFGRSLPFSWMGILPLELDLRVVSVTLGGWRNIALFTTAPSTPLTAYDLQQTIRFEI
jgi:hypothetical protein